MSPKHIPMRTCVACRQSRPKRELVRIVRTLDGQVMADPTGKRAGRGAYLCWDRKCWESALKKKALESALQTPIGRDDQVKLEEFGQSVPESGSGLDVGSWRQQALGQSRAGKRSRA